MGHGTVLLDVILLMAIASIVVITFKKINLSPVLGYLVAGSIIGDHGLKIFLYSDTELLAECGIVFLLFAIGLELSFERLRALRKYVFGLGSLQITVTCLIIAGIASVFGMHTGSAVIIGASLALSSTAIVMQIVEESRGQATQVGRVSLAILLQQDFAVMPLFVLVTLLSKDNTDTFISAMLIALLKAAGVLLVIFAIGRLVLRPVFKIISSNSESTNNEIFIACTILIALSAAYGTQAIGLSMALGAFVAGILVAETEFRTAAEESIHPFKGIFLGMFFLSIGMKLDFMELSQNISTIFGLSCGLIILKAIVIAGLCIGFGFGRGTSIHIGFLLAQGGEFAFIIFKLCSDKGVLSDNTAKVLMSVVTLTMAITPLLSKWTEKLIAKLDFNFKNPMQQMQLGSRDIGSHVIIGGFGTVGQTVASVLEDQGINYISIELDQKIVKDNFEKNPVYRGDISQLDLLKAAGIERSIAFIITIDNHVTTKRTIKLVHQNFPHIPIIVRTSSVKHIEDLLLSGASIVVPEDCETALQLGGAVLQSFGVGDVEVARIKTHIRAFNYDATQYSSKPKPNEEMFDLDKDVV